MSQPLDRRSNGWDKRFFFLVSAVFYRGHYVFRVFSRGHILHSAQNKRGRSIFPCYAALFGTLLVLLVLSSLLQVSPFISASLSNINLRSFPIHRPWFLAFPFFLDFPHMGSRVFGLFLFLISAFLPSLSHINLQSFRFIAHDFWYFLSWFSTHGFLISWLIFVSVQWLCVFWSCMKWGLFGFVLLWSWLVDVVW